MRLASAAIILLFAISAFGCFGTPENAGGPSANDSLALQPDSDEKELGEVLGTLDEVSKVSPPGLEIDEEEFKIPS